MKISKKLRVSAAALIALLICPAALAQTTAGPGTIKELRISQTQVKIFTGGTIQEKGTCLYNTYVLQLAPSSSDAKFSMLMTAYITGQEVKFVFSGCVNGSNNDANPDVEEIYMNGSF